MLESEGNIIRVHTSHHLYLVIFSPFVHVASMMVSTYLRKGIIEIKKSIKLTQNIWTSVCLCLIVFHPTELAAARKFLLGKYAL